MSEPDFEKKATSKIKPRRKWLRVVLFSILGIIAAFVLSIVGIFIYIERNKDQVLAKVTAKLNQNLDGKLSIGVMKPEFFSNFPRVSLRLTDVSLRDKRFSEHQHELLRAQKIDVTVNLSALLHGAIHIRKITVKDASVDIFVAPDGYTNTSVFKKREKSPDNGKSADLEFEEFKLENVNFLVGNEMRRKRHHFQIDAFEGKAKSEGAGWKADISFDILAKSLSFNTQRGSFIKGKRLVGNFDITANGSDFYKFSEQPLKIGGENFTLFAEFDLSGEKSAFGIHIRNKSIRWKNTSVLLADNIREKLDMFDFAKPIQVSCDLVGDFDSAQDPLIYVAATVRHNQLSTPGGLISDCSFDGTFANNYDKKKPLGDPNSVILFRNLTGKYGQIPFAMPVAAIVNLDNPYARGKFQSGFAVQNLNSVIDKDLITFNSGKAEIAVDFTSDVVNYKLTKPKIVGKVVIENADLIYTQKKLGFKDVSIHLDFDARDLFIRNIHIKSGRSDVVMDGKVANFLNLYYDAPEKIVLNWNVYSKELHLAEFLGFVTGREKTVRKVKKKGNFSSEIDELLQKSQVRMAMKIDKLHYRKFLGTNATAVVEISESQVNLRSLGLQHSGGSMRLEGNLVRGLRNNRFEFKASVADVNVRQFFGSFNNFGLETLKSDNISGKLSLGANLSGTITQDYRLDRKSMSGNVTFGLKDGALLHFEPIQSVGKIAFRRRDIDNIAFKDLNGSFSIKGEKVDIQPMKISSNVLNLDVAGIYSFGRGTNLRVDVPLRNPKKDEDITDAEELEKRRHRGIVLHLSATDDPETGKVKIGLKSRGKDEN